MEVIQVYKEVLNYSEETRNALRYGYLYRKEAEKDNGIIFHYNLGDTSEILLWLTNLILKGLAWDLIKFVTKKLWINISNSDKSLDNTSEKVLTDEKQLKNFYVFIKEFKEHRMDINDKQLIYIKEEIVADVVGKEVGLLYKRENRFPTVQGLVMINNKAQLIAYKMIG